MPKYTIDVEWEMIGHIDIEADSLDEAIESAEDQDRPLSDFTVDYCPGSFRVDRDMTIDNNS